MSASRKSLTLLGIWRAKVSFARGCACKSILLQTNDTLLRLLALCRRHERQSGKRPTCIFWNWARQLCCLISEQHIAAWPEGVL